MLQLVVFAQYLISSLRVSVGQIFANRRGLVAPKSWKKTEKANWTLATDTSMTETCALHLSYVVSFHFPPTQLLKRVPPAKAGPSAHHLAAYDLDVGALRFQIQ